eukprot:Transcript_19009.p4 GENE.Transcript_19009~~Transcript_19009.p4  ORF type:complete len:84 (+),score=26.47 Transcript_19009:219-470(+)
MESGKSASRRTPCQVRWVRWRATQQTMSCTRRMEAVSAQKVHARPWKKTSAMKMARQKVLFMHAAPSSAASETVMVFCVFLEA